jgi:hypothetical protein
MKKTYIYIIYGNYKLIEIKVEFRGRCALFPVLPGVFKHASN